MNACDAIYVEQKLRLLQLAGYYDLADLRERKRSNADLVRLFFELVACLQPTLFVEAGAMDAAVSVAARGYLPSTRIVAFEANPYNFAQYATSPELAAKRIEYRNLALAAAPGAVTFNIRQSIQGRPRHQVRGNNSLLKRMEQQSIYEEVVVEGVTFDSFFSGVNEPAAVWMDVEGASHLVLAGGATFLTRVHVLMIEVEEHRFWREQWLARDVTRFLATVGLVPVARDFERFRQFNMLFMTPEALSTWRVGAAIASHFSALGTIGTGRRSTVPVGVTPTHG